MRSSSVYEHFHSPVNEHNRFLSSATSEEKFFMRNLPRYPPFTSKQTSNFDRPKTAPSPRRKICDEYPDLYAQLLARRQNQRSLYPRNQLVTAELETGRMVDWDKQGPGYARVLTYDKPFHKNVLKGYMRQPHENYNHYRKYGFAGKGAKTSWAFSPGMKYQTSSSLRND